MLSIEYRRATMDEQAVLEMRARAARESPLDRGVRAFILLTGFLLLFFVGFALLSQLAFSPRPLSVPLSALSGLTASPRAFFHALWNLFIAAYAVYHLGKVTRLTRQEWAARRENERVGREDLADGRVRVLHCSAERAVQMEDAHSIYWLIEVTPDKTLCLDAASLEKDVIPESEGAGIPEEPIPPRRFDIVQSPVSEQILNVNPLDVGLTDWQSHGEFGQTEYVPQDGEVLEASLDTIHDDLRRLKYEKPGNNPKCRQEKT